MAYQRFRIVTSKEKIFTRVFDMDTGEQLYNVDFIGASFDADGNTQVTLRLFAEIEIQTDHVEVKVQHFDTGKKQTTKISPSYALNSTEGVSNANGPLATTALRRGRP